MALLGMATTAHAMLICTRLIWWPEPCSRLMSMPDHFHQHPHSIHLFACSMLPGANWPATTTPAARSTGMTAIWFSRLRQREPTTSACRATATLPMIRRRQEAVRAMVQPATTAQHSPLRYRLLEPISLT